MSSDSPARRTLEGATYYQILEIDPGASEEEVRQSFKRLKEIYAPGSMAIYTLYRHDELEVLADQMEEAYDTIIDPRTRHEYDLSLLDQVHHEVDPTTPGSPNLSPDDRATTTRSHTSPPRQPEVSPSLPPHLELGPTLEFSGPVLREIREHKSVDLRDVSDRTKISLMNLRYLEDEAFDQMPAEVYTRGFLREYAKYLKLPSKDVVASYMARFDAYLVSKHAL